MRTRTGRAEWEAGSRHYNRGPEALKAIVDILSLSWPFPFLGLSLCCIRNSDNLETLTGLANLTDHRMVSEHCCVTGNCMRQRSQQRPVRLSLRTDHADRRGSLSTLAQQRTLAAGQPALTLAAGQPAAPGVSCCSSLLARTWPRDKSRPLSGSARDTCPQDIGT